MRVKLAVVVARNTTGAPDRIRTCDPWLRKPILYPTELRAREHSILAIRTPKRPPRRSVRARHGIIFRLAAPAADCLSPREYEGIRPAQLSDQIAKAAHHRGSAGVCSADCRHRVGHATGDRRTARFERE